MYARVYPRQQPHEVVCLQDWTPHEEFDPFAPGSKPKGLHWCPPDDAHPFLLPGHLYMFKTGDDWRARQLWSEIIAYELSKMCGINVPPCFVATSPDGQSYGALSEIFLGYPDSEGDVRLLHGADLIRLTAPTYDEKAGRPHTFRNNVRICRSLGVQRAPEQWGAMLAFDALIGNTDRHPENWGVLRSFQTGGPRHWLAPAYDNGTSLGYGTQEDRLTSETTADRIQRFVERGTHHVQMKGSDSKGGGHFEVCEAFLVEFPEAAESIERLLDFELSDVEQMLMWCTQFEAEPRFSEARAGYVLSLIRARKESLSSLVTGS